MRTILILLGLVTASYRPVWSQPNLPDTDYAVFTATLNYLSVCVDPGKAHRRGERLLIRMVTRPQDKHAFRFNFGKDQEKLAFLLEPASTFYTEPGWVAFLSSVDSAKFVSYSVQRPLNLTCRKTELWTTQQDDVYFGSTAGEGHWGLWKKYPDYGGIVSLSSVVYATDATKAVCYCSIVSDPKAGSGHLVFLERQNRQWVVVGNAILWIA